MAACLECGASLAHRSRRARFCTDRCQHRNDGFRRRARNKSLIEEARSGPCVDCGHQYPTYVMEFHHRDPATKSFEVGTAQMRGPDTLRTEIEKCDVLCANCHLIRHHDG